MNYNPNIHHRHSIRLQGYDYSQAGLYFITICCENMVCRFGTIEKEVMLLNDAGKIADECWLNIPIHFPNAILHPHIVMPNHIHGIIEVGVENILPNKMDVGVENLLPSPAYYRAEDFLSKRAENFLPLQPEPQSKVQNKFQNMIPRSIGSIVKGFKIGVSKWFRQNDVGAENFLPDKMDVRAQNFVPLPIKSIWQRNYYEHIIRDGESYQKIADYIVCNPSKWNEDKFHFRS